MRNLLPIALSLFLLASCSKETTVVNTYPDTLPFRLRGVRDLVIERSPFLNYPGFPQQGFILQVVYGFGNVQRVQLSATPLSGIGTTFSVSAGTPDFISQLTITDSLKAPAGTYEMRLTAQPDSGLAQTLKFDLRIMGDTSCTDYFAGKTYRVFSNCPQSGTTFEGARLERIVPNNDTLLLSNFRPDGLVLKIVMDCNQRAVTIPTQLVGGNSYTGTGTLNLVYGSPPATPYFQLQETTAGGTVTNCSYSLQML